MMPAIASGVEERKRSFEIVNEVNECISENLEGGETYRRNSV